MTERLFRSKLWFCGRVPSALLLGVGLAGWMLDAAEMQVPMMRLMLWSRPILIPIAIIWFGFDIGWRTMSVSRERRLCVFGLCLLIGAVWGAPGAAMYIWVLRRAAEIAALI